MQKKKKEKRKINTMLLEFRMAKALGTSTSLNRVLQKRTRMNTALFNRTFG